MLTQDLFNSTIITESLGLKKRVKIIKGPKDVIGKLGYVGEVRHGLHNKSPKIFTVDLDNGGNIQLPGSSLKLVDDEVSVSEAYDDRNSMIDDPEERARIYDLKKLYGLFGGADGVKRARYFDSVGLLKASKKEKDLLYKLTDETGKIKPRIGQSVEVTESYWQDVIRKVEAERKERRGMPFEKNPASHDEQGVYIGDKDLAGNPVPKSKEQEVRDALKNGDDYTAKQLAKMASTPEAKKYLQKIIRQEMYSGQQGVAEGYTVTRGIDKERYQSRSGLEGPFSTRSGKVVYYDKAEGKYYDPDTDMYIEYDDWKAMNDPSVEEEYSQDVLSKMNKINRDYHTKNPHMTSLTGGRQVVSVSNGARATKVKPMNAPEPVTKKSVDPVAKASASFNKWVSQFKEDEGVAEGRFVKGPGGVPLDRQGNPKIEKPKMPKMPIMSQSKPKLDLDKIWFDVTQIISNIFPDGDPADYLPKYCKQHVCTYDDIRAAAKKNGYEDEYAYIDDMKTGDYGYQQDVAEGYKFKGPFPFDVDHMPGPVYRYGDGPKSTQTPASSKKIFTDKVQWEHAVNDINSSVYDDNSDYISRTGVATVQINGITWAKWNDVHQKGYIDMGTMTEQGVVEGDMSPMAKDAQKQDKIRSLKNLISIAKKQGRQLRVQELELELKKLQGVAEGETEKNPHTSALGRALYRDLSKVKKVSPQQVQRNKERWAQRQQDKANDWEDETDPVIGSRTQFKRRPKGVSEGSMPYPHGKPEAGDKITWYHSNRYPEIEGTVVGWKDGSLIVQSVDPSSRNTEKTVAKYRVPKNNILSVKKQDVAEGEATRWRVEQSESGRYYVVTGYQKRKIWKNKLGAVDFVNKADAQRKADELNQGVAEGSGFDKWADDKAASQLHKLKRDHSKDKKASPTPVQQDNNGDWEQRQIEKMKKYRSPDQGVAEGSLNEFAPGGNFKPPATPKGKGKDPWGDDDRSQIAQAVKGLLASGNKVDWQVPGQMGHVVSVDDMYITLRKWNQPRSKMRFALRITADRDSEYLIVPKGEKHYRVISSGLDEGKQGVAEGSLNEFAQGDFNRGDDEFDPGMAKQAQEAGFVKGVSLADGSTLATAFKITGWDQQFGGLYKQYFANGFKEGRMDKIRHDNRQHKLNLKLMKDGSIRHGEQGVVEAQVNDYRKLLYKYSELALQANRNGDDEKCKLYQQKMNAIKDKMAKQAKGVAEGAELKTFRVMYYNPTTDRNHTRDIKSNNESDVWDKFKSKGLDIISITELGLVDKDGDERGFQYRDIDDQGVAEGKSLDPDLYEEIDGRLIARAAKQILPGIRARVTQEGYVELESADGLSLSIGAGIHEGSIGINIGSIPLSNSSSGTHKGAVTAIIKAVYDAIVRKYGTPSSPGSLSVDHDASHGAWQHIAQKLGLEYGANLIKEGVSEVAGDVKRQQGVAEGSYKEGGSITHDGVEYDFDKVLAIAETKPTKQCAVSKLAWVLAYDKSNTTRLKNADISVPIVITKSNNGKLTVIDGLHRLAKAVKNKIETLPVKCITNDELQSAHLKKGVAEGWKEGVGYTALVGLLSFGAINRLSDLVNSEITGEPTNVWTNWNSGVNRRNNVKSSIGQGIESVKSISSDGDKKFEMTLTDGRKVIFTAKDLEKAKRVAAARKASEPVEVKEQGVEEAYHYDRDRNASNWDNIGEEYEGDEDHQEIGFFVAIGDEEDGGFIGMINKEGGKWRETAIAGNTPYAWGGSYMGYLSPNDVMQWINRDYGRSAEVAGPFETEEEAREYAAYNFGLGGNLSEGKKYYTVTGTTDESLTKDFGLTQDQNGWFLLETASSKQKIDAYRAFGSPKIIKEGANFSAYTGSANTLGGDSPVSPIGSIPKKQPSLVKAQHKKTRTK